MIGVDDLMGTLKLTDFMEISLNERNLVNLTVPTRTVFAADSGLRKPRSPLGVGWTTCRSG